ncbi:MAG: Holliday junction resolvase RuvX [Gammaproteobacteria bacterium]|nr:Holliday junction resolvase RuvX [Gammaproteobacteria bacterium]
MPDPTAGVVRVLAFDFGLSAIGVAVGQSVTQSAEPLQPLKARNGKPDWTAIDQIISSWNVNRLVVGLPLNMDDTESDMSTRARQFAAALEARSALPVILVDERLSSREAMERTAGDRTRSHGIAAVLIAESYLRYVI